MLADVTFHGLASARPNPARRPAIRAHARRLPAAQGVVKRRRRCGIPVGLAGWYGPVSESRGDDARGGGGSGRGWHQRRGRERAACRGGDACRGGADVGAAELASGWRRQCARVQEGRLVGEERRVRERRRIGKGPLIGEGRVGDGRSENGGREARRRFGGKWLSADLEGDGAYTEPPPFVTGRITNRD
jgi:hypothetical protein